LLFAKDVNQCILKWMINIYNLYFKLKIDLIL
jgi:hypothetical protein